MIINAFGMLTLEATMSLKTFHVFSHVIRFDDKDTRRGRRERDKLSNTGCMGQVGPAITLSL